MTISFTSNGSRLLALAALLLAGTQPALAQQAAGFGFEFRPVAKVVQAGDTLRQAWAGGLNSPQFSNLDLNADQQPDLVVFDRISHRLLPFLSVAAAGGGRTWLFAPEYAALFPNDLQSWVLLRDYDCDGRPDLFTADQSGSNIRVFRNEPDALGRPGFRLITNALSYFAPGIGNINIAVGGENMPAIADVDGDGRLDVITTEFGTNTPSLYYYRNTSTAACGGLSFALGSDYWGGVRICGYGCGGFTFAPDQCRPAGPGESGRPTHATGYNLTVFDVDGDGRADLLTGRSNCAELTVLRNEGTAQLARFTAAGLNAPAPFNGQPPRVPNLPAAYSADVDFDGLPDLLLAPNLFDNRDNNDTVDTRNAVQLYRNTGAATGPKLTRAPAGFLHADMLDVGEQAAPTFADLDGDGLPDMLVGGLGRPDGGGAFRAVLSYYRNVGTRQKPVFQLIDADYLGLSRYKLAALRPVLADLNEDGRPDLLYSSFSLRGGGGSLRYVLNTAAAGQLAAFSPEAAVELPNLPNQRYTMPAVADVDGDGHPDLLLGVTNNSTAFPGGPLRYYRNSGTGELSQRFRLENNDYGQLRNPDGSLPGFLSPVVADFDRDGRPDLLTAATDGSIRLFADLRAQPAVFAGRSNLLFNPLSQQLEAARWGGSFDMRLVPAAADVNGDGVPELFLGQETGGISSFVGRGGLVTANQPPAALTGPEVRVFPNPATARTTVEANEPVRLTVLDLLGRTVRPQTGAARVHQVSVAGLAAGVYLVRCQNEAGAVRVRRLTVQ
ncbi:T9SS type A sorting domain-containing protein [Hymenobacter actinosclerus]|uniref:Por secretion system C-terminal sorting domain-containing protein n=1 Tax=Hymenobacter actinosclerus TaxID=82805 RepID=A0A1H9ZGS7_9BACT|nr:T9SS type A sorting domain-containing protein [Hymenobacter actinosclerus]SES80870.1 Por secretion system C-terminal sorting domain-containing protein [Hymenobacter actinosclerus]